MQAVLGVVCCTVRGCQHDMTTSPWRIRCMHAGGNLQVAEYRLAVKPGEDSHYFPVTCRRAGRGRRAGIAVLPAADCAWCSVHLHRPAQARPVSCSPQVPQAAAQGSPRQQHQQQPEQQPTLGRGQWECAGWGLQPAHWHAGMQPSCRHRGSSGGRDEPTRGFSRRDGRHSLTGGVLHRRKVARPYHGTLRSGAVARRACCTPAGCLNGHWLAS